MGMKSSMKGFIDFIRKQGVVGLAIGFLLGGAVSKLVTAFIDDIVNPIVGIALGATDSLATTNLTIGPVAFKLGHFVSVLLDFMIVAFVIFFGFKMLGLEKLDKPKE